ncbi:hypothetical protein VPHD69_0307 [Vibrio phage D69]
MSASTTIVIPGRETQTIPGLVMTKSDVIAAYAGDIDLSNLVATEESDSSGATTITFANKTGTKGNDIYVSGDLNLSVDGDVNINNTRIVIPGREAQTIPGIVMGQADVRAAFAGEIELGGMDCVECVEGDTAVITFANKTGTKGQTNLLSAIFAAVEEQTRQEQASVDVAADEDEFEDEDDFLEDEGDFGNEERVVLRNTLISIPGREAQTVPGIVMDAQMVKDSFAGDIDLSGYNVEETEVGDTLEVRFSARTGTKGINYSK